MEFNEIKEMIQKAIDGSDDIGKIAILPYGENGMLAKQILNQQYGIEEAYIVDNTMCNYNGSIISLDELIKRHDENLTVLLNTTKKEANAVLAARLSEADIKTINIMEPEIFGADDKENYFKELKNILKVRKINGFSDSGGYVRIGNDNDGGYVMWDDFDCGMTAYSIGICDDISWDADINGLYGIQVDMYDHTIRHLPQYYAGCRYHCIGIGAADNLGESIQTLETMLLSNGDLKRDDLILKMDVEGAEWDVINATNEDIFGCFRQIVMEFHGLLDTGNMESILSAFLKLNKTHQVIWVHGNNFRPAEIAGGILIPDVLEACFVNRRYYQFEESDIFFPLDIDMPNWKMKNDFTLGNWGGHMI